jgi:hypothetical protein
MSRNDATGGLASAGPQDEARHSLSSDSAGEESQLKSVNYSASKRPYTTIPPVLNAYQTGARMRTWLICGESKSNAIFRVSLHFGLGLIQRGPLGMRPGIYLHNGTTIRDPILAAAGDEDQWSQRYYAFNNKSIIVMPYVAGDEDDGMNREWHTEYMVGSTTEEEHGVVFRFALNAGPDDREDLFKRERFEWKKFKKGTDKDYPGGGFKLFRLPRPTTNEGAGGECVAVWELDKTVRKYWDHMYTLTFVGSGLSNDLGERWKAVVVVTAARLWAIRLHGRTKKSTISMGEKISGKSASSID